MASGTILIVDDDPDAVVEIAEALIAGGWRVATACSTDEAIAIICDGPGVEVVLTDLYMTGASGFDLIVRSRERASPAPAFVIMTGHPSYQLAVRALRIDAVDFVEKPISMPTLMDALDRALSARRQADATRRDGVSDRAIPDRQREAVADLIRLRDHVRRTLSGDLSSDPCLDIILHIADAEQKGKVLSVSSACAASGVPQTTALRRIEDLENAGLVERRASPSDRRLSLLHLTEAGRGCVADIVQRRAPTPSGALT